MSKKEMTCDRDQYWMQQALALADKAAALGEVPVGAVVVVDDNKVGEGWNQSIVGHDPSAHAEIVALRQAAATLGNYRLVNADLYVTLEPCSMCAGAMIHARIRRLVFATFEPKAGVVSSQSTFFDSHFLNHKVEVVSGILQVESAQKLTGFFRSRRQAKKKPNG